MIWTPRVTVAAIIEDQGRFLVVEEDDLGQAVINQPAGHLEDGESLTEAVRREVLEETGWQFEPTAITGIYRWRHPGTGDTFLRFCFCGPVSNHQPNRPLDPDIFATHWLNRAALARHHLRSPLVLRCLDDYLAGKHYPLELCHDIT